MFTFTNRVRTRFSALAPGQLTFGRNFYFQIIRRNLGGYTFNTTTCKLKHSYIYSANTPCKYFIFPKRGMGRRDSREVSNDPTRYMFMVYADTCWGEHEPVWNLNKSKQQMIWNLGHSSPYLVAVTCGTSTTFWRCLSTTRTRITRDHANNSP